MLAPDDSVVYAPRSAALLLNRAMHHGARLLHGTVARLLEHGVVLSDGRALASDCVVLANGLQAAELAAGLPLRAKKGHLAITDRYPGMVRHQLVELGYLASAHAASGDSVLVEVAEGEAPLVVGVLHTRRPREIKLKAGIVEIEGEEEVVIRSGRGAIRIRADGDIEVVGSRISAASRGLFRIVGRMLRLN